MSGEPGFLVTGSGRSGTGYLAAVLNACGLNVGHEGWWTLWERTEGLDGDVSWLGCFDSGYTGPVYAQVRNPARAIPSIYGHERVHPYYLLRAMTVPFTGDWSVDAALIWLRYTRRARERARRWWRVEDVDAALLGEVFGVEQNTAEEALGAVPRDVGAEAPVDYPWPRHPVTAMVRGLAVELGYRHEGG